MTFFHFYDSIPYFLIRPQISHHYFVTGVNLPIRDNECKPYEFIRYGVLSSLKQEWFKERKRYYHCPPVRHGIYVMPKHHFNISLVYQKVVDPKTEKIKPEFRGQLKHIQHRGKVWTHYYHPAPNIKYYRQSGSWYETDTDSVENIIREEIKYQRKYQSKLGMYNRYKVSGKGIDLAKIKQMDNQLLWDEIEFFIERI